MEYLFSSLQEMECFLQEELVGTQEAADMMGCSRQYIHKILKQGKLTPALRVGKDFIFWKQEIALRVKPSK